MGVLPNSFRLKDIDKPVEFDLPKPEEFCDYAYDFYDNSLKLKDGKHYFVYGNEALKIWIYKAMRTSRFRYKGYSGQFGTEVYTLVGEVVSDRLKRAEIKRYLIETLMVHPFITQVDKIDMEPYKSGLNVDVYFRSIFKDKVEFVSCVVPID